MARGIALVSDAATDDAAAAAAPATIFHDRHAPAAIYQAVRRLRAPCRRLRRRQHCRRKRRLCRGVGARCQASSQARHQHWGCGAPRRRLRGSDRVSFWSGDSVTPLSLGAQM